MTLMLAAFLSMIIVGAAVIGWLLRWYLVLGDDAVDPRELGRLDETSGMPS